MKKKIAFLLVAAALGLPLTFTTGCAVTHHQETAGNYARDKEITARIKTSMYADPLVKGTEVKVTSLNGVVQLSGFVNSQAAIDRAGQIAAETPGVVKVYNNLLLPTGR
ncbi:MAG TPA: BON domain-containing protein [Verrucomicrobiae bacterium]|nr:BON domain-containing protein [Verrucomicrobiae bacterium]